MTPLYCIHIDVLKQAVTEWPSLFRYIGYDPILLPTFTYDGYVLYTHLNGDYAKRVKTSEGSKAINLNSIQAIKRAVLKANVLS